jgi:hypothetical protein
VASDVGLVDLDQPDQPAFGPMAQCRAKLVEQRPSRLVASEPRIALQLECGDALLVAAHEEDRPEPGEQRDTGTVEHRPRGH